MTPRGERRPRPHKTENRERRETEPTRVVRAFLFQSIAPEDLPNTTRPEEVQFTRMLLTRKGGINSPGQLVPVGGNLDRGETVVQAARREIGEETHLHPTHPSFIQLPIEHRYRFFRKSKNATEERLASYCLGRLLPEDKPFALDPKEDKIAAFEYLTIHEYRQLRNNGYLERDGIALPLFSNLIQDPEARAASGVESDQKAIDEIHKEIDLYFQGIEAHKKLRVLRHLIVSHRNEQSRQKIERGEKPTLSTQGGKSSPLRLEYDRIDALQQNLEALQKSPVSAEEVRSVVAEIEKHWKKMIHDLQIEIEDIQTALHYSNMEGIRSGIEHGYDEERGDRYPSMNLAFPFLAGEKPLDLSELRILHENPQTWRLLEMTRLFTLWDEYENSDDADVAELAHEKLQHLIFQDPEIHDPEKLLGPKGVHTVNFDTILKYFAQKKYIDVENDAATNTLSEGVDRFFEHLQRVVSSGVDDLPETFSLSQSNEVVGATASELLGIIFHRDTRVRRMRPDQQNVVRWEAKRKILLMMMFAEAKRALTEIRARGVHEIEYIEQELQPEGKSGPNARVLELGGREYNVRIENPGPKSPESMLGKQLSRDQGRGKRNHREIVDDVYRSAYIFMDTDPTMLTLDTLPPSDRVRNGNSSPITEPITTVKPLIDLIRSFIRKADDMIISGDLEGEFFISDFKPLNKSGEAFQSSGSGGGGASIRMAKFNLCFRGTDNILTSKEIQVFLPRIIKSERGEERIVSGRFDYENKKEDDEVYALARLFTPRGTTSPIRALWPERIYGTSARHIHAGVASRRVYLHKREERRAARAMGQNPDPQDAK